MRLTRVTLFFIAFIMALGFYQLARYFLADVEPQTYQATEEMMVDTANLLAQLVEPEMRDRTLQAAPLAAAFDAAHARRFEARIYDHLKTSVGLHAYITDAAGKVLFDSDHGRRTGMDFSRYRDVALTLAGAYGARSSREDPDDQTTSILYVAAPIGDSDSPIGVLTVFKPQLDVMPLVRERRRIIYTACGLIGGGILFLIAAVFLWLFRPVGQITEYARAIERGERPPKPRIGIGREVNTLAGALDSMRDALENRQYVERYIRTLTHEMKSPLAAIRGAAELLNEEMPAETRKRVHDNLLAETSRSERLINRLLELAAIESRKSLDSARNEDFPEIVQRAIDQARPLAEIAGVTIETGFPGQSVIIRGDAFILRATVTNLLENAIDFSPRGSSVSIRLCVDETQAVLTIRDHGSGIPDYARERVFDRFYSLRHHDHGRKGTGLGLTLVKEAAELHGGTIALEPATGGGTEARLTLPLV
jgi:two-component system sensor histidine kinase CreC